MRCPVCGYENAAGAATCGACGTQLVAAPEVAARPTDARCQNHPEQPALQPCSRCGTFYCAACLEKQVDGQMQCAQCRGRATLPWDQRAQLGTLRAWFKTCTQLLLEPTQTLSAAARDGEVGSSLLFGLISTLAGVLTSLMLCVPFYGSVMGAALSKTKEGGGESAPAAVGLGLAIGLGVFFFYLVMFVAVQIASMFALAGVEHLVLNFAGEREIGSYTVTLRAHALGLAPFVLGLIPGCGPMVMGIWSIVLRCITLMHLQRVSAGKAVLAVLGPVVLVCGCVGVGYFAIIAAAVGAAGLSR